MVELEHRDFVQKLFRSGTTDGGEIHRRTAIPSSTVFRILGKLQQNDNIQRKSGSGKQRIMQVNDGRYLVSLANQNCNLSIRKLTGRFNQLRENNVSSKKIMIRSTPPKSLRYFEKSMVLFAWNSLLAIQISTPSRICGLGLNIKLI